MSSDPSKLSPESFRDMLDTFSKGVRGLAVVAGVHVTVSAMQTEDEKVPGPLDLPPIPGFSCIWVREPSTGRKLFVRNRSDFDLFAIASRAAGPFIKELGDNPPQG